MHWVLVELRYGAEDRQACARGTLGVIVVRFRIAEIGHHAVAEVLRDMPAEALDCLRRRTMVLADDLSPLFRIEMPCYLGRADQIAEKHRQMSPLALKIVVRFNTRRGRGGSIERCCAFVTKFCSGFVVCAAARTFRHHRRSTFAAKLRSLRIFG